MVMKKLFLISFLLISLYSLGQPGYTDINSGYRWLRGNFRALHVPSGTSFGLQTGQWPGAGALYLDTAGADSGFYYRGVNASWHRLPKATETFYLGDGTFSSNRTVSGGGFSLAFNNLSSFSLNAIRDAVVRSDLNVLTDSIVFQPHDGKINIDSLRSGHPTDTTTYKPMVWSPTNKSWRYLTSWPSSGGASDHGALTGLSDDDHTQYALLLGRSGGQYLIGGTAANDDLTLEGTSNATKTSSYVILQPTSGNVGINNTAPWTNVSVGTQAAVSSATPVTLSLGGTFGSTTGDPAKAKLKFYDDGTANNTYGMGISSGLFEFHTSSGGDYAFFHAGSENIRLSRSGQIILRDVSAPSSPASGTGAIYVNTDAPRFKDDGGNVTKLNEQQTRTLTIESPSSSENISFFYTDKAITITKAAYAVRGSSPSVTIDIHHSTDRSSGSPNELFGTNVAVTSTTGTTNTTFNDATIPAGSFVWFISSASSGTNNELTITLTFTED
jgi:hypothetical protein